MVIQPQVGAEPIEGYRLVERLGSGGFGEVWKAVAPGGLSKAVKFVFGSLDDRRAEQELKSLSRIKEVRHPFLLSLERFEVIDGQLIIVTELADYSLRDRFVECREQGLIGIPRDELLVYIRDAADALDYMSEDYGLQHLDVKPENLLLVGKRVKVADFGLVKDLHGSNASVTGGVTPVYATPEAFDGKVSRQSDQYSLAIVYQEMLTGLRPFPGKTPLQLAVQHLKSPPMLDPLCPGDRQVLKRALAKQASDRYPTCKAMVEDLLKVEVDDVVNVQVAPQEEPVEDISLGAATIVKAIEPAHLIQPVEMTQHVEFDFEDKTQTLRPTLIVGIGGVASEILQRLHARLFERIGDLSQLPIFRFLQFDTDRETLRNLRRGPVGEKFSLDETVLLPLRSQEEYRPKTNELLRWLDRRWLYGMPRSLLPEGRRALGRLALIDNASQAIDHLQSALTEITSEAAKAATQKVTGLSVAEGSPRILVVACIAGGTGGGMLVDFGYMITQVLRNLGMESDSLLAVLPYAAMAKPQEKDMARANAYATMIELDHFFDVTQPYPGSPNDGISPAPPDAVPFSDCYVVHFGENLDWEEVENQADYVAEYLYLNLSAKGSAFFDNYRGNTSVTDVPTDEMKIRSFGLRGFCFPRHRLAALGSIELAKRIGNEWRGSRLKLDEEAVEMELLRLLGNEKLDPNAMMRLLDDMMAKALPKPQDQLIQEWISRSPLSKPSTASGDELVKQLKSIFAYAEGYLDRQARRHSEGVFPELADQAFAHATSSVQVLTDWLRSLLESPRMTIVAAEWATRWLIQFFVSAAEDFQAKVGEMQIDRRALIADLEMKLQSGGGRLWFARKRVPLTDELRQQLAVILQIRFRETTRQLAAEVLRTVYRDVSKLTEQFVVIRQRLNEFVSGFSFLEEESADAKLPALIHLLPNQATTIEQAAHMVVASLPAERIEAVDRAFRERVMRPVGGMLSLQTMTSDQMETLRRELVAESRVGILKLMAEQNAAELFAANADPATQTQMLLEQLRHAAPRFHGLGSWQHLLLAVPEGDAAKRILSMVRRATPNAASTTIDSEGDVIFCFEAANLPLQSVADSLINNDPDYVDVARKLVTRTDIRFETWKIHAQ